MLEELAARDIRISHPVTSFEQVPGQGPALPGRVGGGTDTATRVGAGTGTGVGVGVGVGVGIGVGVGVGGVGPGVGGVFGSTVAGQRAGARTTHTTAAHTGRNDHTPVSATGPTGDVGMGMGMGMGVGMGMGMGRGLDTDMHSISEDAGEEEEGEEERDGGGEGGADIGVVGSTEHKQ